MIKRIARWILRYEMLKLEDYWFEHGVNQMAYMPETCKHALLPRVEYMGEEE
jgi:hypothetical protein